MSKLRDDPEFKKIRAKVEAAKTWSGKLTAAGLGALAGGPSIMSGMDAKAKRQDSIYSVNVMWVLDDMLQASGQECQGCIYALSAAIRGQTAKPGTANARLENANFPEFKRAMQLIRGVDPEAAKLLEKKIAGEALNLEKYNTDKLTEAVTNPKLPPVLDPIATLWKAAPWIIGAGVLLWFYSSGKGFGGAAGANVGKGKRG